MRAVDTNVVVRILVGDDAEQSEKALAVLAGGVFVSDPVLMEVCWVLQRSYGFRRPEIRAALTGLISLAEVSVDPASRVQRVLELMDAGIDPGDAFVVAAAPSGMTLATFDRRLARRASAAAIPVEEP